MTAFSFLQIAVVNNQQTLKNLPKVEGLLLYRSDDRKLYFRGKTHWKTLGTEKEVRALIEIIANIYEVQSNHSLKTLLQF